MYAELQIGYQSFIKHSNVQHQNPQWSPMEMKPSFTGTRKKNPASFGCILKKVGFCFYDCKPTDEGLNAWSQCKQITVPFPLWEMSGEQLAFLFFPQCTVFEHALKQQVWSVGQPSATEALKAENSKRNNISDRHTRPFKNKLRRTQTNVDVENQQFKV